MADRATLLKALRNADAAGDTAAAQRFVAMIKEADAQPEQGNDDIVQRGSILPLGRTSGGELEFAVPEFAMEAYESMKRAGTPGASPEAITEAALNAGMGATRPLVGGTVAKQVMPKTLTRQQVKSAPTVQELRQAGGAALSAGQKADVKIGNDAFSRFSDDLSQNLRQEGYHPLTHPKTSGAIQNINDLSEKPLEMIDIVALRKNIGDLAGSPDKSEARLGMILKNKLDDFVEGLTDNDLIDGGDIQEAAGRLKEGRKIWQRMAKAETIENAINKAKDTASGFENGLRIEFRKLKNRKGGLRGFDKDEIAAIDEVIQGTPTRNAMRFLGKFGFDLNKNTNALGAAMGGGIGYGAGGPLGAVALPAAGSAARYGSEKGTEMAANIAQALAAGVRPQSHTVYSGRGGMARALGGNIATPLTQEEIEFMRRGGI